MPSRFEHLKEEEDTAIPAAVNNLTRATEMELTKALMRRIRVADIPLEMGWVLHAASPLSRQLYTSKMPALVRWQLPKVRTG